MNSLSEVNIRIGPAMAKHAIRAMSNGGLVSLEGSQSLTYPPSFYDLIYDGPPLRTSGPRFPMSMLSLAHHWA